MAFFKKCNKYEYTIKLYSCPKKTMNIEYSTGIQLTDIKLRNYTIHTVKLAYKGISQNHKKCTL